MLKVLFLTLLLGTAEAKEKPYFLEGCPVVQLSGNVHHCIMPGAPNYESVDEGDFPSERWFFEPNEDSRKYLQESGVFERIPDDFRPVIEDWRDRVTMIQLSASGELEEQFSKHKNVEIVLEGWLGSWDTYCSTFFFEVSRIIP